MRFLLLFCCLFYSVDILANFSLKPITANELFIKNDLKAILQEAKLPDNLVSFEWFSAEGNYAEVICNDKVFVINIYATDTEWSAVLYNALQQIGFLFPHPRIQISPEEISSNFCGKTFSWQPALQYRGFHFHTMHPNEWVHGFMMNEQQIAYETINWLARNQQNIFDFNLLRTNRKKLYEKLKPIFEYANQMGIYTGLSFGAALQQQNNLKLVSILGTFSDRRSERQIDKRLTEMLNAVPVNFISVETGTSEFTAVNYERSLKWMNQIANLAEIHNVQMMGKVHISSNQTDPQYGNYNFLPQYANSNMGILPHTVFYYALEDENAPMYGNQNFSDMKDFMLQEKDKRMTWFYPETSYYIGLDIGAPLLHVEYLRGRAADMKLLNDNGIIGQLNFTTGHENGYWLFDWTVALLNNKAYNFNPYIALELLGEDKGIWEQHAKFHYEYMTQKQLVQIVTFSNGGDELMPKHKIHDRNLLKELSRSEEKTKKEIQQLEEAIAAIPTTKGIKNNELKTMLDITYLRFNHALYVRKALLSDKETNLSLASKFREQAIILMQRVTQNYNRYPEAKIFGVS